MNDKILDYFFVDWEDLLKNDDWEDLLKNNALNAADSTKIYLHKINILLDTYVSLKMTLRLPKLIYVEKNYLQILLIRRTLYLNRLFTIITKTYKFIQHYYEEK